MQIFAHHLCGVIAETLDRVGRSTMEMEVAVGFTRDQRVHVLDLLSERVDVELDGTVKRHGDSPVSVRLRWNPAGPTD